ncbi:MAG: hypothetical protein ACLUCH_04600 [Lachnospirales bacterium]
MNKRFIIISIIIAFCFFIKTPLMELASFGIESFTNNIFKDIEKMVE